MFKKLVVAQHARGDRSPRRFNFACGVVRAVRGHHVLRTTPSVHCGSRMARVSPAAAAALILVAAATSTLASGAFPVPLALLPAARRARQAFANASLASWGGSVIEVADDATWRFHLFATAFVEGCGLNEWLTNGVVIHAVANDALGPFVDAQVALPLWRALWSAEHTLTRRWCATRTRVARRLTRPLSAAARPPDAADANPQVRRLSDGTFLLFAVGTLFPTQQPVNCSARAPPPRPVAADSEWGGQLGVTDRRAAAAPPPYASWTQVYASSSPYGPWSSVAVAAGAQYASLGADPAPVVLANDTVVLGVVGAPGGDPGLRLAIVGDYRCAARAEAAGVMRGDTHGSMHFDVYARAHAAPPPLERCLST